MLRNELLDLNYYLNKLSQFMRGSYGIEEQFEMIHQIIVRTNTSLDETFEALNVMSSDYTTLMNSYDSEDFDILDKIASIYGVSRDFSVQYHDYDNNEDVSVALHLSNSELLTLIRARIIQNTYQGTFEESKQFYSLIGYTNIVLINDNLPAVCRVFCTDDTSMSSNTIHMFRAGLLTLKSLGITYQHYIRNLADVGIWDISEWDGEKEWF